MSNKIKFKRKLSKRGDSIGVNLPSELYYYIGAQVGSELILWAYEQNNKRFIVVEAENEVKNN